MAFRLHNSCDSTQESIREHARTNINDLRNMLVNIWRLYPSPRLAQGYHTHAYRIYARVCMQYAHVCLYQFVCVRIMRSAFGASTSERRMSTVDLNHITPEAIHQASSVIDSHGYVILEKIGAIRANIRRCLEALAWVQIYLLFLTVILRDTNRNINLQLMYP